MAKEFQKNTKNKKKKTRIAISRDSVHNFSWFLYRMI